MSSEQRRFQVFVSSTYVDLREARQQVTMTLLECDAFPTGMEIFPAADDDAWTLIRRVIDESDYYLLVIAGKYGSVNPASGLSYTEMEYDYAVSAGKPVMAFLHGDLGELKSDLCESTEARREKLENFREKVRKAKHVKFWKSPEELAGQVALTYNKFVRQYPATGWVRADQVTSTESLKELIAAKSRVEELEAKLRTIQTSAPAGAEHLAQGDDECFLFYYVSAKYRKSASAWVTVGGWVSAKTTWDSLFAAIAPQLLQEAEETALRKGIEQFVKAEFLDENINVIINKAKTKNHATITTDDLRSLEVEVRDEEFGTVLVQLMALGLIRRSDRKRSVNDTGTYWALTPYGEMRTIQLRAIKRKQVGATDSGSGVDGNERVDKAEEE